MNREQFTVVFDLHYPAVLAYGLRRVDRESAQEMASETFTIAWRRRAHVPDPALAWLLATARRVLANEFRRESRSRRLVARLQETSSSGGSSVTSTSTPDHARAVTESAVLHAALGRLAAKDREILQLVAWEGLGPEDLATAVGCSPGAAKVRLHRARARLRAVLDEPGPAAHAVPAGRRS